MTAKTQARAKAERGIRSSEEHAGAEWQEEMMHWLRLYLHHLRRKWGWDREFIIEDFRLWAASKGAKMPEELRAFGALTQRAQKERLIRKTQYFGRSLSSNYSPKRKFVRCV